MCVSNFFSSIVKKDVVSRLSVCILCRGVVSYIGQGLVGQLDGARAWGTAKDDEDEADGDDEEHVYVAPALGQLTEPSGVAVLSAGGVWVADYDNHRVCMLH